MRAISAGVVLAALLLLLVACVIARCVFFYRHYAPAPQSRRSRRAVVMTKLTWSGVNKTRALK